MNDGTARFVIKTVCAKEYVDSKSTDEAKKWKNAYNNLRKRSYPAVFYDDEQTLLASPLTRGDITLSQPYTNFDFLYILYNSEVTSASCILSTYEIKRRLASDLTYWCLINGFAGLYWTIKTRGTTPTFFPFGGATSVNATISIRKIIGIKFKEIT